MNIYISVVSHGHYDVIKEMECLPNLDKVPNCKVFLLDNVGEEALQLYSEQYGFEYILNESPAGFGANNNTIYSHIQSKIGFKNDDYFLVLNPDVKILPDTLLQFCNEVNLQQKKLSTLNLYKDYSFTKFDTCIRMFPSALDFITSYLGLGNRTIINKDKIQKSIAVDWAAGSFLLFKATLYKKLGGFDPGYFMYCEDIDICWRSKCVHGESLTFFPNYKALHLGKYANRSFLSKHFVWHLKSMFRYLTLFYRLRKPFKGEIE